MLGSRYVKNQQRHERMLGSPVDIAIVAGIALILFGPKKFPEIGKALGQGLGNFKRALHDAQDEVKTAVKLDDSQPSIQKPCSVCGKLSSVACHHESG